MLVAQELRAAVLEPAFFGRLGGEEFLVVLPDTALADARRTAEEFLKRILSIDTVRWFADRRPITASIGVTVSTTADTPSTTLRRADTALYAAKRAGHNCVRSDPSLDPRVDSRTADAQTRDLSGHGGAASPAEP